MGTYFRQEYPKDKIIIHHTAGSADVYAVSAWWDMQNNNVSTSKIIGGIFRNGDARLDGFVLDFYDPKYWSYHLGVNSNGHQIEKTSIGIELTNYGGLRKTPFGEYINYVHGIIPEYQVEKLDKPFRGFSYYQAYTQKQIDSLKAELLKLAAEFNIDLHLGMYALLKKGRNAFEIQTSALNSKPGLWGHVNYRRATEKQDPYPSEILIEMILSL